jgi:uncharacterized protein DUF4154
MTMVDKPNHAASEPRAGRKNKLFTHLRNRAFPIFLVFCLALVHAVAPKTAAGQDSAGEYELKAAMLFNLTRFVEWPASAYANVQAPTVLCILGRDPFGDSLSSLASNPVAGGRAVQIRHISNDREFRTCHVVYIGSSERKSMTQILSTLKGVSVLTVGETAQFAARGGMIQFSLEEKQVHFEINVEAASDVDLKISSRLLVLARIVKDQNRNSSREGSTLRSLSEFEVVSAWRRENIRGFERNYPEAAILSKTSKEFPRSR